MSGFSFTDYLNGHRPWETGKTEQEFRAEQMRQQQERMQNEYAFFNRRMTEDEYNTRFNPPAQWQYTEESRLRQQLVSVRYVKFMAGLIRNAEEVYYEPIT